MANLSPFVYWAQSEENVFLKVDLKDSDEPEINLKKRKLYFKSKGEGARGINDYQFSLDFHSNIKIEESSYKVQDSNISFVIVKETRGWWPRLISQPQKPAWLKIDFDKWQSEEDVDYDSQEKVNDIREDYKHLYEKLQKEELGYSKEEMKKVYLGFYNLFMFIFFVYILVVLIIRYLKDGEKSFSGAFEAVGSFLIFVTATQFLEVLHCILGFTKGNLVATFIQIGGRMVVAKIVIASVPSLQTSNEVFYLFVVWSFIEVIRYPFYITQVYKKEIKLLTWLRYNMWIPLYPVGLVLEVLILFKSINFFEETGKYSISLPNSFNFSFYFPSIIRVYLLFFAFPVMYLLISHMYIARKKKYGKQIMKKIN